MRFAETGFNLEIDLSTGDVERVESDPRWTEQFLGGLGTNTRILWDRVGPEVGAFDEDNLLIFAAGLLVGTPAPGATRTILTTISPQTGLMAFSMMGGFFGAEMKHAGYDKIVVRGKSEKLIYLWVHNDKVEIRDAAHLSGMGSNECVEAIRRELGEPRAQAAAIGLAGENRVFFASVEHGRSSASRMGIGGVMGAKGIKAVVVRGSKDLNIARPAEFFQRCQWVLDYIKVREDNPVPNVMPIVAGVGSPPGRRVIDEWRYTTDHL